MNKYIETLSQYNLSVNDLAVTNEVEKILLKEFETANNKEVYAQLFNCIDLTSLNNTDTTKSIIELTEKVNQFDTEFPQLKNVAAICVYPNFAETVRSHLEVDSVKLAVVAGGFPYSQTFTEIKVAETSLALIDGADEIDIVMNLGHYYAAEFEELTDEISEVKDAAREAHLKVIIESGTLKKGTDIKKAALLSIHSGADFIKTSTGKTEPAATFEAAYVICETLKEFYDKTGRMIGFKVAGGVVNSADAVKYYCIVKAVLGEKWLTNEYFRIGASRLSNNLLSDILGEETKFF